MQKLTDVKIRTAKPTDRPYKLADGGGLHLYIAPTGTKSWRYRYELAGREKTLTIGEYPEVSLASAREKRDAARIMVAEGKDPSLEKRVRRAAATSRELSLEVLAREWHERQAPRWAPHHASDVITSLAREIFPLLGPVPIGEIDEQMILGALQPIEVRGAIETARRIRQRLSAVFCYAMATGRGVRDPAAIVKGALLPLPKRQQQPAVTTLDEARRVVIAVDQERAHPVTKLAHRLLALTAVRSGALRGAFWDEFHDLDSDSPIWVVPAARMKGTIDAKTEHTIPLARQAVDVLRALRPLTGRGPLAFPSPRSPHRPMSENAIGYMLNRIGLQRTHTAHGWRATFSTIMNERYAASAQDRAVIDLMLGHVPQNKVERVYNRADYLPRRRELAQEWADLLLEGTRPAADLLKGPRR